MAYKAYKSKTYEPGQTAPFRISRSKIDMFIKCPRCFYLDQRLGIKQPDTYPLTLNIAVDELLKKEFDIHRAAKTAHPFMKTYGIDAVPYDSPKMDEWRDALKRGVECLHGPTNFSVRGGVDDIWVNPKGELIVVDYKATSKADMANINLDGDLGAQYQRQMEVYQWLLRQCGYPVSKTGYFVYVNGKKDAKAFDGKLEFDVKVIPCEGETAWIEPTLFKIKETLESPDIPTAHPDCDFCRYRFDAYKEEVKQAVKDKKNKASITKPEAGRMF